jgi:uncharacterized protein with HEPN domain
MVKDNTVYLKDIFTAIIKIEKYSKGIDYEVFSTDDMRHDAILRQLEIIGEAANRLSSDFKKRNPSLPWKEAIDLRNFLIHGYHDIELEIVWKTIIKDLPILKVRVEEILNS